MIVVQALSVNEWMARFLRSAGIPFADLLAALVTFVLGFVAVYLLVRAVAIPLLDRSLTRRGVEPEARGPVERVAKVAIAFVAIGIAFGLAGFGNLLTSLATVAAAATLAIGFALQDTIKNVVAGIFIFTDRPFRVGDWIEWNEHSGIVEDISFRVSRVRTFDNELLTVPNSLLTDGVIKNPVAKGKLRVRPLFGIDYDDDVEQATEIVLDEADEHPDIMEDPEPSVRLTELADSYVGLESRIWIANPARSDFVRIRGEYMTAVKERFDEAGITIPFPQRTLSGDLAVVDEAELPE